MHFQGPRQANRFRKCSTKLHNEIACVNDPSTIEQVAWNKSGLILKIILQNSQTLQLFTINIQTEMIYKSNKNAKQAALGLRVTELY